MRDPHSIAVIGVTGYSGFELATLLLRHPGIAPPTFYVRDSNGFHSLSELFPQLRARAEAPLCPLALDTITSSRAGTAFLATPHEASAEYVPLLRDAGLRVIDLSGAFRFRSAETFRNWYKLPTPHADRLGDAVYGLPEFYAEEIRQAKLVANPGCYATSVILALRPLLEAGLLEPSQNVICDCKSGASGAGKEPRHDLHFVEVGENFRAYSLFSHRHTPEILEHTGIPEDKLVFTTHLLPVARGILSTIYVSLASPQSPEDIEKLYRRAFSRRPMVRIWPTGRVPELQHVTNSNFCDIGFTLDAAGKRLVIVSCLDNLGKGAAGQAVQNFNLMMGFEEQAGLL